MKPLSFGEILDGAFTLYRRGFGTIVPTVLLTGIVAALAYLLLGAPAMTGPAYWTSRLVRLAALAVAWIAITWQVSRLYTGRPASLNEGLTAAGARLAPLLGAWAIAFVLYGLPVLMVGSVVFRMGLRVILEGGGAPAGYLLMLLPWMAYAAMTLVGLALAFAIVPAVVLEGAGPWPAVARSFRLAESALVRVAALMLVSAVLASLAAWGVGSLVGFAAADPRPPRFEVVLAREGLKLAAQAFVLPFTVAACVLMYYDLRVRNEALDLQLAADELSGEPEVVRAPAWVHEADEVPDPDAERIPLE